MGGVQLTPNPQPGQHELRDEKPNATTSTVNTP